MAEMTNRSAGTDRSQVATKQSELSTWSGDEEVRGSLILDWSAERDFPIATAPPPSPGMSAVPAPRLRSVPVVPISERPVRGDDSQLNWYALAKEDATPQPLIDGFMERGQLASLYGMPKCGKSLLALEWAANLARKDEEVLYLDRENDPMEVRRRLESMGLFDPEELWMLDYRSFPEWFVDTEDGADEILKAAEDKSLIVFDSWARFFATGEQSSDSAANRALNGLLMPLKRRGVAVLRLDHTNHDGKRPSGTIVKLQDVDHGWRISYNEHTRMVSLTHTENRTGRGEDVMLLQRFTNPLRHSGNTPAPDESNSQISIEDDPVLACMRRLDDLGVPTSWGRERARQALAKGGKAPRTDVIGEAVRRRKANPDPSPGL